MLTTARSTNTQRRKVVKRILICFTLILLTVSCTTEKKVRIDSFDEYLDELSDHYDDVNSINVTYIAFIFVFNVDINQDSIDFDDDKLLVDLQTFLNKRDNQKIIREYFHENYDREKLNPALPEMHIFFTSYDKEFAKYYYSLHIEYYDDGSGTEDYNFLEEWEGPYFNLDQGYR